ncbi:MAG: ABC transporter permease [Pseudomonadota bacterium]
MNMRYFRGIGIAIKSLISHPLRVALALVAVMIGVGSVIVMVGIGKGAEAQVRGKIEGMGTNLLVVAAGQSRAVKGKAGVLGIVTTLTLKDSAAITDECPFARRVAPAYSKKMPAKYENVSYSTKIVGTVPSIRQIRNIGLESGSFFDEDENRLMAPVAVVGHTVIRNLFYGKDPVGESIRIGKVLFKVVGVTVPKGDIQGEDEDDQVFVPFRTAVNKLMNVTHLSHIYVETRDFADLESARYGIRTLLRERHRLGDVKEDDFTIQSQADVIEAAGSIARTFSLLIAGIAFVALLIGGVGILGVMLLSIRERVVEIGIRRAVGARRRDILIQFLVESSFLGFTGGGLGIVAGSLITAAIKAVSGMPIAPATEFVIPALAFSVMIGMASGIYPAWKAACLDPIEALNTQS